MEQEWLIMIIPEKNKIAGLCEKYDIELLILFGSYATGHAHPESDIDLAIMFPESVYLLDKEIEVGTELMEIFQTGKVDVIVLNLAEPLLLKEVAAVGVPLFERRKGLLDEYQLLFIK